MRRINTVLLSPNIESLIIIFVNCYIKLVNRHFKNLGTKFPSPCSSFLFKIVTEREITEHFKKCSVTISLTNLFNIGSTNTFLAGCNTISRRCNFTCKILFHRRHTRIDKKQAVIIIWNK